MDPSFWGRSTWKYLHTLTFNYPMNPTQEDKIKMFNYFNQLPEYLPCSQCAESFKLYLQYIPVNEYLDNTYSLVFWLYNIHHIVNLKLKKTNANFNTIVKEYLAHKTTCEIKPIVNNVNSDNSGKCTAPKNKNTDKYTEFINNSKQYNDKIKMHVGNLIKDHPTLQ